MRLERRFDDRTTVLQNSKHGLNTVVIIIKAHCVYYLLYGHATPRRICGVRVCREYRVQTVYCRRGSVTRVERHSSSDSSRGGNDLQNCTENKFVYLLKVISFRNLNFNSIFN
jgi:hypothetical protein